MNIRKGKKVMAALLVAAVMGTVAIPTYADSANDKTMELNTSKSASYIMSIPNTQSNISFGAEDTVIGNLSVTGNIGTKQQVQVTVEKTDFVDKKDNTNKFSFSLLHNGQDFTGQTWNYDQVRAAQAVAYPLTVHIPKTTWNGTKAGSYNATLTFKVALQDIE